MASCKQAIFIEVAGVHTARDEHAALKMMMRALEREEEAAAAAARERDVRSSDITEGVSPSTERPRTDTEYIATSLEVEYEERMLASNLEAARLAALHLHQRRAAEDDEHYGRLRLVMSEEEFRRGLTLVNESETAIAEQREARRRYDESKLAEVESWAEQARRMNELDSDFVLHDRRRTHELMARHEAQRQAEEEHWRRRREAERQATMYADEDELLTQDLLVSRLGLVRPTGTYY
jgi:hypothetical protein